MYDLAGSNFYNPNWGYQNGAVRNSREYRINQPVTMLRHDWKISDKTHVFSTFGFQFGKYSSTRLDWYDAADPRPDYYRKLPSYATDDISAGLVADYLKSDENHRQVNWASMYAANAIRDYTFQNVDGIAGNTVRGKLAAYIVEEEHYDNQKFSFNSVINSNITENLNITGGLTYLKEKVHYYRQVDDLLGADFYIDYNRFALRFFPDNPEVQENDLNRPTRLLKKGDIFGHNYNINTERASAWTQAIYKTSNIDYFGAVSITNQSFYREGFTKTGLFPDNSFGKSTVQNFLNYAVKGGITYKINGRNYIVANASYRTRAPFANESYVSPRTKDQIVKNLTSEKITSGELSYLARYTKLKGRVTAFYTDFKDKINSDVYYHEDYQTFVNYIQTGIDRRHLGVEVGLEYKITSKISLTAAGSLGQYIHTSRPLATISRDNSATDLVQDRVVYINNYYVAGMPQQAGTLGLNYSGYKWFFNVNVNYFAKNYLQFNPDRRTAEAIGKINPTEQKDLYQSIIAEEKLPDAMTVDIFCGKTIKLGGESFSLNLNIGNILNNTNFRTGGFEQLRFDNVGKDVNKFPPRYFYAFGTNFTLNISYIFK
ncbi:MAG: TonB-dependent receptor [Saprospiraceae bacterium]|nr:TonB-dependent receptor [Saprospiraceae bacterium]